jgi:hypothetical protein
VANREWHPSQWCLVFDRSTEGKVMSDTNRRKFLGMAGAGAAVAGAVSIAPSAAFAGETARKKHSASEPVVAYVEDVESGELHLMVGEREVVVHDRDLVNRILNAAGR